MTEAPKLSLACASRSRPEKMYDALESARTLAHDWSSVEVVLRADICDPRITTYQEVAEEFGAKFVVGERTIKGAAPYINSAAMNSTGDLIFQFTDDQLVKTQDWDLITQEAVRVPLSSEPCLAFYYDERRPQPENPVVSRGWLEKAGCFYPPGAVHFFVDTILFDVARSCGKLYHLPIEITHQKAKNDPLFFEIRQQPQNEALANKWRSELMELMK